jgi:hypothetical protein
MTGSSEEFRRYLATDETVVDAGRGTLVEDTTRTEGAIGVTDRRLLFVGSDGFTDVRHDRISSIRSRPHERLTDRGRRFRVLALAGAVLTALAMLGQVLLTPTVLGSTLGIAAVAGFAVAEAVRRIGVEIDREAVRAAIRGERSLDRTVIQQRWETEYVYAHQFLLVGASVVGTASALALLLVVGSPAAFALTFVALGGLAGVDVGLRRIRQLRRREADRRAYREVDVRLVSGQNLTLQVDPEDRIDVVLGEASVTAERPQRRDHEPASGTLSGA